MNMNMKHAAIPLSIIFGFGLVAATIYFTGYTAPVIAGLNDESESLTISSENPQREGNQNIYGNPDAEIKIVEFSDYECPFCMRLHTTLKKIVDESDGKIGWEYRHFPLPNHRTAGYAAAASECLAREVSNEAFWEFTETIFSGSGQQGEEYYKSIALSLGATEETFDACINSDEIKNVISSDMRTSQAHGGNGTPYSVIVFGDGTQKTVNGALPYEHWVNVLGL